MKKEILKSKMCLIALASILFVSCGGGGGGSSNLPIKPTPSVPSNPTTPSTPTTPLPTDPKDFQTDKNPLDSQKGNMSALKVRLETNRESATESIPSDTRTLDGSGVRIGILDSDFNRAHDYNAGFEFSRPFEMTIDVGRPEWDTSDSISPHGEQVLEVLMDRTVTKTSSFFNNPLD